MQHVIKIHNELCWEFLQNDACIYVAGNAKNMPLAVREELVKVAKNQGAMSDDKAELFIRNLEKIGRYQVETW